MIILSVIKKNFNPSLPVYMTFIYFTCNDFLVRNFQGKLIKVVTADTLTLFQVRGGIHSVFLSLDMLSAVVFPRCCLSG